MERVAPASLRSLRVLLRAYSPPTAADLHWESGLSVEKEAEIDRLSSEAITLSMMFRDREAIPKWEQARRLDPNSPQLMKNLAMNLCVIPGRWEEANQLINKAVSSFPTSAEAWVCKSIVQFCGKKFEDALLSAERSLEIDPTFANTWVWKGLAQKELRRFGPAVLSFDRALEIEPTNFAGHYNRGHCLFFLGKVEEAFAWLSLPVIDESTDAFKPFVSGLRAYHKGEYESALKFFIEAPVGGRNDPADLSDVVSWQGECLLKLGRLDEALAAFDRALGLLADDPLSLHGKGEVLSLKGKAAEAQACFDRAVTKEPLYYKSDYFRIKTPKA